MPAPIFRALRLSILLLSAATVSAMAQVTEDTPGWFPFVMSPLDPPGASPIDLSGLNVRGTRGRIAVEGRHFVDPQGERVRFFGTNVTFSSAFPDQKHAPALAKRLAQLGFNVVRFHHLDARDIWKSPAQEEFDAEKLDRMDFFIAQLKERGIYVNMNLHVSRTYPGLRGLDLPRAFRYGKLLDKFYEPYIGLQEEYATDLLDRINPHTGMSYLEDPAVAFVELNNENSLLQLTPGLIRDLPPAHREALRQKWTAWLGRRYGDMEELLGVWNAGVEPLRPEMLADGGFERGLGSWDFQRERPAGFEMAKDDKGNAALQLRIEERGSYSWAYQLHQSGLPIRENTDYTLTFRARSDPPREITAILRFARQPWTTVTSGARFSLGTEWGTEQVVLRTGRIPDDVPLRLSLNLGSDPGQVSLGEVSLREGHGPFRPVPGAKLSDLLLPGPLTTPAGMRDYRLFLIDTERAYVERMRAHLENIGCRSLIVDTQANYGGLWGLRRETSLNDYVDIHAYWQHPRFPNKPWDRKDWTIPNTSMVAGDDGGTFARLARYRAADRPHSVSEYNHPWPNDHAAEMVPLLASFAAHQDWDAIYQFCYGNSSEQMHLERITGYFDLARQPAQLVFAPCAALLFREGLVSPAPDALVVTIPEKALADALLRDFPTPDDWLGRPMFPPFGYLNHRFGVRFSGEGVEPQVPKVASGPASTLIDSGHLHWTHRPAQFIVRAPAVRVAVGEIGGRGLDLGDVRLELGLEPGTWICAALVSLDSLPVNQSQRLLFSVATRAENSGMGWNRERTTVGDRWGSTPVVVQDVPGLLVLPGGPVRAVALDPAGVPTRNVEVSGGNRVKLGGNSKTLWYYLEREES